MLLIENLKLKHLPMLLWMLNGSATRTTYVHLLHLNLGIVTTQMRDYKSIFEAVASDTNAGLRIHHMQNIASELPVLHETVPLKSHLLPIRLTETKPAIECPIWRMKE